MTQSKLFVFRPSCHGIPTYSIMDDSKGAAEKEVKEYILKEYGISDIDIWGSLSEKDEQGNFVYETEIYKLGEVAENDNS